jgi:hypothetical protein
MMDEREIVRQPFINKVLWKSMQRQITKDKQYLHNVDGLDEKCQARHDFVPLLGFSVK